MTSELVGCYDGTTIVATVEEADGRPLGRYNGRLVIPPQAQAEVTLLKTIAVLYVMDTPCIWPARTAGVNASTASSTTSAPGAPAPWIPCTGSGGTRLRMTQGGSA